MPNTLVFWLLILGLLAAALALLLPGLLRRSPPAPSVSRAEVNAEVYRNQIADLDRDLADGSLDPAHHAAAREELQRRLLADNANAISPIPAKAAAPRWVAAALALGLPAAALGLYFVVGSPASVQLDAAQPVGGLLAGQPAEGDALPMRPSFEQLQQHLERQPNDGRAQIMLARMLADRGDWTGAAATYEKAMKASRKVAGDPGVLVEYADVLGMEQGGQLAGKPEELIGRALMINARHPRALEMAGSLAYEKGQYKDAASYWEELLSQLQPGTPMHTELATAIERCRAKAQERPAS
ncbi:MAG: c-type cytochrome biogenesis protein CcmI [Burkholderiaceae bacterium]